MFFDITEEKIYFNKFIKEVILKAKVIYKL